MVEADARNRGFLFPLSVPSVSSCLKFRAFPSDPAGRSLEAVKGIPFH